MALFNQLDIDPTIFPVSHTYRTFADNSSKGVIFYDRPSMLEAYRNLLSGDGIGGMELQPERLPTQFLWNLATNSTSFRFPVLLNWYPNALTVKSRLVRLGLPDCMALRARVPENSSVDVTCDFEVNQLVKASWAGLVESAPLVKQLLDKFNIKQSDYIDLLRRVSVSLILKCLSNLSPFFPVCC